MRPDSRHIEELTDLPVASADDVQAAGVHVWRRLQSSQARPSVLEQRLDEARPAAAVDWRLVAWAAAAILFLAASVGTAILWPRDTALYRVVDGTVQTGDTIQTNGGGAQLALVDGSRVEMRSQSELSLERADDGLRIRLSKGGIIVNAAEQRTGHLYVQTKDITVSVIGTVFLVNAGDDGSRVAVIEGEVRVQHGVTEKTLLPGEQVATNPAMAGRPVRDAIAWSRNAPDLFALLRRSAVEPPPSLEQAAGAAPAARFEIVSIRPAASVIVAPGARGGGGGAQSRPTEGGCVPASSEQIDPGRLAIRRATLFQLIAHAYPSRSVPTSRGSACELSSRTGLISGGPDWIKTEMWDLEATVREGIFSAPPALTDPRLQQMLATALADRFKVVVRRDTREMPVYVLKVGNDGPKFNGRSVPANRGANGPVFRGPDGTIVPVSELPPPPDGMIRITGNAFSAYNVSMANWAEHLFGLDGRPVIDRTGLTGRYDFHFEDPAGRSRTLGILPDTGSLNRGVVAAMGFELEESRAPFDVWVIVSAERPSEN